MDGILILQISILILIMLTLDHHSTHGIDISACGLSSEMQHMPKSNGHANFHNFRLPYEDWRIEIKNSTGICVEDLFTEKRFGATCNASGFPHVVGDIVGPDGWHTLCSQTNFQLCDPNINAGQLQCYAEQDYLCIKIVCLSVNFMVAAG